MDAGTAIGAVSLTIQLFDGAVKGFDIFERAIYADQDCEQCKLFLRIEYDRLEQWGIMSGLDSDDQSQYAAHIRHNAAMTVPVLGQLNFLLKKLRRKELEYDFLEPEPMNVAQLISASQKLGDISGLPLLDKVAHVQQTRKKFDLVRRLPNTSPDHRDFRRRCLDRIKAGASGVGKVAKQPKRFKWAVRDMKHFKANLELVHQLVTGLTEMLSRDQISMLLHNTDSFKLTLLQLTADIGEMKTLLAAGHGSLRPVSFASTSSATLVGSAETPFVDTFSTTTSFWEAATLFSIQASQLDISKIYPEQPGAFKYDSMDTKKAQTPVKEDSRQLWIEWKSFSTTIEREELGPGLVRLTDAIPQHTVKHIKKLVALLQLRQKPVEFSVPNCVGFFEEKKRYGLVFEPPPDANIASGIPQSLFSMYARRTASVTVRISIAQKLSECLLYLHAVNWLHKGFQSRSVLFFSEKLSKGTRPYVGGFEYSRAATDSTASSRPPEDTEQELYTHPSYLRNEYNRFRKTYDMYSLGIVLLELAYWKPVHQIPNLFDGSDTTDGLPPFGLVRRIRQKLLQDKPEILEHVEEVMGERYFQATRTCLKGMDGEEGLGLREDQDQSDPSIGALIQQAFIERIVDPLKSIVI